MGWNDLKGDPFSQNRIKLSAGDSIEGVFRGEPYVYYDLFGSKTEFKSWAEGRRKRFRINFVVYDPETEAYAAKILQGGSRLALQIWDQKEEQGLDAVYKVKRVGSGRDDTRYTVVFKRKLTKEEIKKIEAVKSLELGTGRMTKESPTDENEPPFDSTQEPPPDVEEMDEAADDSVPF